MAKGEQMVNCPTCGGSGWKYEQKQRVITDADGKKHTVTDTIPKECPSCDGMGVIPGGPPV